MQLKPLSIDGETILILKNLDLLEELNGDSAPELDAKALKATLSSLKRIAELSLIKTDDRVDPRMIVAARMRLSASLDQAFHQVNQILAVSAGKMTGSEIGFPEFDPASSMFEE